MTTSTISNQQYAKSRSNSGLTFITDVKPKEDETFTIRKVFQFNSALNEDISTAIELELYPNDICVMSFYEKAQETEHNKFRLRSNVGSGHVKAIFKACLEAYYSLPGEYALVFSAANDLESRQKCNPRYSAYRLFLSYYFRNYDAYTEQGCEALNTFMLYHGSFTNKDEADTFYHDFKGNVASKLTHISTEPVAA